MKVLALLFLVSCASASFYDALDNVADEMVLDFMVGMEKSSSLTDVLGYSEGVDQIEHDIKNSLAETFQETIKSVIQKIRDSLEHGKQVADSLVSEAKELVKKLKDLGLDAGSKVQEVVQKVKENIKVWLRELMEKIGFGKRGITDWIQGLIGNLDLKSLLEKLKNKIAEKLSLETIIAYVKKFFGETTAGKVVLFLIRTQGLQAIKDLIRKILPSSVGGVDYDLIDMWQKVKDFFKDLGLQAQDKFTRFAEWIRDTVKSGFENAKDKAQKLKQIAKEVIEHSKTMTKETAREALEFFEPYKNDLGVLWDELKEAVKRVVTGADP